MHIALSCICYGQPVQRTDCLYDCWAARLSVSNSIDDALRTCSSLDHHWADRRHYYKSVSLPWENDLASTSQLATAAFLITCPSFVLAVTVLFYDWVIVHSVDNKQQTAAWRQTSAAARGEYNSRWNERRPCALSLSMPIWVRLLMPINLERSQGMTRVAKATPIASKKKV